MNSYSRDGERWTEEEAEKLVELREKERMGWGEIAEELERSKSAVRNKYYGITSDKSFHRIKLSKWIAFDEVRGGLQVCSVCQKKLDKGEVAISIRKVTTSSYRGGQYNIWIHIGCFDKLVDTVEKGLEEHKGEIVANAI